MRTTKIKIRNLFGITETELDGRSVELTGANGVGKTSVIDALRYALTNKSDRDIIVRQGEKEGEILIETDTGLSIDRKKRTEQADYKSVKENGKEVMAPENFLRQLFTPLQLDPVAFTLMDVKSKNRAILDLIEYDWDLNFINDKFGEIPSWINYEQNILEVLSDMQSENGQWFKERQNVNRDIRNKQAFIEDIAKDIPADYQAEKWEAYDLGAAYKKLEQIKEHNSRIERAKLFRSSYDSKLRKLEADKMIEISAEEKAISTERETLLSDIERMKAQIKASEDKLAGLSGKLEDKKALAESRFNEAKTKLDADMSVADEYTDKQPIDFAELQKEVENAEEMKRHLNEYSRMKGMQSELEELKAQSDEYTRKIELARTLPGEILETAKIPIEGFTVQNGIPLINGLPVANLSEGEQLSLCVDVAISKPNGLQVILIDGTEKLSSENREKLYSKCHEKGIQFIATRTTDSSEMEVHYI
ncbi:AAA family ATPase [Ruminococcus flavefaciens]|uniref:AAA family ATPase n=1 Tax=Ruminococcus flavefaciens TaxID=1265 RepID=UPI001565CE74|nr:AAA family ATPase [Ruminococcus flavefaciens]